MSDLYTTIRSLHLHGFSDSDSDSDSRRDRRRQLPQSFRCNRTPTESSALPENRPTQPSSSADRAKHGTSPVTGMSQSGTSSSQSETANMTNFDKINRSVSFNLLEKNGDSHSPGPPLNTGQRKLPNGVGTSNNPNLKGILLKPKRMLPAQPDTSKVKRLLQESSLHYKPSARSEDKADKEPTSAQQKRSTLSTSEQGLAPVQDGGDGSRSPGVDVDKLKSHFEKQQVQKPSVTGKTEGESEINKVDRNEPAGNLVIRTGDGMRRSQSECAHHPEFKDHGGYLIRERTMYDFNDQLSKVEEWCSPEPRKGAGNVRMSSDPSVVRNLKLGIRSPSPKSSTTWDRSSSGYSSDERQDPRSPPPPSSSSSLKSSPDAAVDGGTVFLASRLKQGLTLGDSDAYNDSSRRDISGRNSVDVQNSSNLLTVPTTTTDNSVCDREAPSPDVYSHTIVEGVRQGPGDREPCHCDKVPGREVPDPFSQINFSDTIIDASNTQGRQQQQQTLRRPAWTSNPAPGGRIQYRKAGTESMISLRHTNSGRNNAEHTNTGLEVYGKSCAQSARADAEGELRPDTGARARGESTGPARGLETPQSDTPPQEYPVRPQEYPVRPIPIKKKLIDYRSARDPKALGMNVNLSLPKDDKDIRKTLHDLNSPRRRSTPAKAAPIRARHTIHVTPNQPTASPVTTVGQGKAPEQDGKPGIKFFGKKMWRAPSGQPEGVDPRPFSPFGGTLPPSKIKKKKVVEVLV